jgi:hypothetical protein
MGYASNRYRLADPNIIRGVVVWTDGNWYVVRDITGRDVLLYTDSTTVWHDSIGLGDRIIAYTGPSPTAHVDFVA